MGFLDGLMKQAVGTQSDSSLGGLVSMVSQNPQILSALTGLLSSRDASIGGSGGLNGLIGAFQKKGLGNLITSWISTGPNPPVTGAQINDVLGQETIAQFARKAGVQSSEASSLLAGLLPAAVDHLTPDGRVPETNSLESSLSSLLSGLVS